MHINEITQFLKCSAQWHFQRQVPKDSTPVESHEILSAGDYAAKALKMYLRAQGKTSWAKVLSEIWSAQRKALASSMVNPQLLKAKEVILEATMGEAELLLFEVDKAIDTAARHFTFISGPTEGRKFYDKYHVTADFDGWVKYKGEPCLVMVYPTPSTSIAEYLKLVRYTKLEVPLRMHVAGVKKALMVGVRTFAPKQPELLKDGGVSQRKISTTWDIYLQTIMSQGLRPESYTKMRAQLLEYEMLHPFAFPYAFDWEPTPEFETLVLRTLTAMHKNEPSPQGASSICTSCAFTNACWNKFHLGKDIPITGKEDSMIVMEEDSETFRITF